MQHVPELSMLLCSLQYVSMFTYSLFYLDKHDPTVRLSLKSDTTIAQQKQKHPISFGVFVCYMKALASITMDRKAQTNKQIYMAQ